MVVRVGIVGSRAALAAAMFILVGAVGVAAQAPDPNLIVKTSPVTGLATFVTAKGGGALPLSKSVQPGIGAIEFLRANGAMFGIIDADRQLIVDRIQIDELGLKHTTLHQQHSGVPVFSGMIKVHQNAAGQVVAVNGDFYPITPKLNPIPALSADAAAAVASALIGRGQPVVEYSELVIVDPGWYGDPSIGAHLAYHLILEDLTLPVREAFFVDAHSGAILDRWDMIHTARVREVYNGNGGSALPGTLARSEGQGPVVSPVDVNRAYDYAGDVYDYYFRAFGRDSIDDNGMTLVLTVNSTAPPCPNAFWSGTQMVFCTGTVTDDITAHEITHGVTERTANLIYQNQAGQLNEAYSDIFGEMIDLFNGNAAFPGAPGGTPWPTHATGPGLDTPNNLRTGACSPSPGHPDGVRWMLGEDATAFGGAIRDMWNPPCEGHPDRANSPLQTCNPLDSGGVHSGSGIANHAFSILTDGKTFNGFSVSAIGSIKSAAVWYRALTIYLTPGSDFKDAYNALNQSAQDLIGTTPSDPRTGGPSASMFTAADALEVDKSLLAVEMNTDGACGATVENLDPTPPTHCPTRTAVYADDFEGGVNGWTVSTAGPFGPPTPYTWEQVLDPVGPPEDTAWFADDPNLGDCAAIDESAVHSLFSPVILLPANLSRPSLTFDHFLAAENGYDGGNLSVRVNAGPWQLVPVSAFLHNAYNTTLISAASGNTNPMASQPGWTGAGGIWGTSLIDLSGFVSGGDSLQVRFDFGKDGCTGVVGWYLDHFELYTCPCDESADCDDGQFCNGVEACSGGVCQPGSGGVCGISACDEETDSCLAGVRFRERFEEGNLQNWTLYGPGSTATAGEWVIGNPNGTSSDGAPAQPENAFEGMNCAFTAQNSSLGVDDVDNGVVYLVSRSIDLTGATEAQFTYRRWFFNRDLGEDVGDFFSVDVSGNDGGSWVNLETLGTNQSANSWQLRSFALDDFIPLSATVRLRFGTGDGIATGNLIEAAVDDLTVSVTVACITSVDCDDGVFCNGPEQCQSNQCVAGTAPPTSDGVACTVDACDENLNAVVHLPNDALCANATVCDGAETCHSVLGCQPGAPVDCDDDLFCTGVESCDALAGCLPGADPCAGQDCDESANQCTTLACDAALVAASGSRSLSIAPAPRVTPVALRVVGEPSESSVSCVSLYVQSDGTLGGAPFFATPATWSTVHVTGAAIIPGAVYRVETDCSTGVSPFVTATTHDWGDVDHDGDRDSDDILLLLGAFVGFFAEITPQAADLMPCDPNSLIDVDDLTAVLDAFVGDTFDQFCPLPCP